MASILDVVDSRTQLVGENRLELLMFRLAGRQVYAINVFKIQEVQSLPALTPLPGSSPLIRGVTHVRGTTVPVIDLSLAIGMGALDIVSQPANIIITEYNQTIQAFLVRSVERIANMNWNEIMPPPKTAGRKHFLTAITQLSDLGIVEIVDVEKVLALIIRYETRVSEGVVDQAVLDVANEYEILLVDDSTVGLAQAKATMEHVGVKVMTADDGAQALARLKRWADEGIDVPKKLLMLVTDAEMPEMDGYRLTAECRSDPRLQGLYIVLHTSLSGRFNNKMVEKVGCDDFLSKFQADGLATAVQNRIRQVRGL